MQHQCHISESAASARRPMGVSRTTNTQPAAEAAPAAQATPRAASTEPGVSSASPATQSQAGSASAVRKFSTAAEPTAAAPGSPNIFAALGLGRAVAVFSEEAAREADASTSATCAAVS